MKTRTLDLELVILSSRWRKGVNDDTLNNSRNGMFDNLICSLQSNLLECVRVFVCVREFVCV